jgi:hypothetical protein
MNTARMGGESQTKEGSGAKNAGQGYTNKPLDARIRGDL